ncbi:hypothetical protein ASZ90_004716 [hydrocarbon metagenome]|uniref:Secretion system C-terminal sorting domain-containing protein n=1 Tax=hydrocarbon metagenome TaxID=938273 RepID=A0A0W8FX23_9ZZZZ
MCYDDNYAGPEFGLGKYRVNVIEESNPEIALATMTIDYRTSHLPECGSPDFTLHFNASDNKLYFESDFINEVGNETIWDLRANIECKRAWLEPVVPRNFFASDAGSYPTLTWNHSLTDADSVTAYEIHRAEGHFGFFSQIGEVSATSTSYVDYDYVTGRSINLQYKIRAKNGTVVSQFTDVQSVFGDLYKESNSEKSFEFALSQNYPNPFNPSTTITYSIPNQEFVNLKIYDSLGKEIVELVNEEREAGIYCIEFNAENLPSGLYFYTISAGNYSNTKKLLLIK